MFDAGTSFDLLSPFVAGVGALSLGLWKVLARPSAKESNRSWPLAGEALILAATLTALTALNWQPRTWVLPAASAGLYAIWRALHSPLAQRVWVWLLVKSARLRPQGAFLAAIGMLVVGWCVHQANSQPSSTDELDYGPAAKLMAALHEDPWATAETDRGRKVRLFTAPVQSMPEAALKVQERRMMQHWNLSGGLIRKAPPDGRADCHGWTFTDGRWWIQGPDVPLILEDNGYEPVSRPQAGDLVVYCDLSGTITHTGVVFAVGERQEILVESKWCWLGRYLHAPESQPYGTQFGYYRSPRGSHGLRIRDRGLTPDTDESGGVAGPLHEPSLDRYAGDHSAELAEEQSR
jgi:hypothetical protein